MFRPRQSSTYSQILICTTSTRSTGASLTTLNDDYPNGVFYRRALKRKNFSKQCIGINKLSTLMKSMCEEGGLEAHFTNHFGN